MRLSAPIFRLKRQAKQLSRQEAIPLHEAQDRIARTEGFQRWSHLSAHHAKSTLGRRLDEVGADPAATRHYFSYDTSEEISARYIVEQSSNATTGALIVIDYLQMLDQQRRKPVLADQIDALSTFAQQSQSIVVLLSQIDRTFDRSGKDAPDLEDIRLPNPVDLGLFSKSCFVHDGQVSVLVGA